MLDVLMYLFENYVTTGAEFTPDEETLSSHLEEAGFAPDEIKRVFGWLEGLAALQATNQKLRPEGGYPVRFYDGAECKKLGVECRGFLYALEQAGVLSPLTRELVIERALSLEGRELTLEQLKWIVVFVLFHKPMETTVGMELKKFPIQSIPTSIH